MLLLLACTEPPSAPPVFVRSGAVVEGSFRPLAWKPGENVEIDGRSWPTPRQPECVPVASVDLGDVARLIAMGGSAPDTALAFAPDGRLAVGSYLGELLVLDPAGKVLVRRKLAESAVKVVAWSPDGRALYAGEQSPDALLHALDPATLQDTWTLRLADHVGSSPAPAGDDLLGVYTLPAVMELKVRPDGRLLVLAAHGWTDAEGRHLNASRLLELDANGNLLRAFPADGAADATLLHLRGDEADLLLPVSRSADGAPAAPFIPGTVIRLRTDDWSQPVSIPLPPLEPWFPQTYIWEAFDAAAGAIFLGSTDGRVWLGERLLSPGAPVLAGELPLVAAVGHGRMKGDRVFFLTSDTTIPWGAAAPDLRPPSPHPAANTVHAWSAEGEVLWTWTGPQVLEGLEIAGDTVILSAGKRTTDERSDLFGAVLLDAGTGALQAFCATESPTFFKPTMAADGRVAVAEHPWVDTAGALHGAYRVTLLR